MRGVLALVAAVLCFPAAAHAQESYAPIVREHATGNSDAAITSVMLFGARQTTDALRSTDAVNTERTFRRTAALHTEWVFRGGLHGGIDTLHLADQK